jgi:hypothetical protein
MILKKYPLLCGITILLTILYFAWNQHWILINVPTKKSNQIPTNPSTSLAKKNIRFFIWYQNNWRHEDIELLWSIDQSQNIEYIVRALLTLLDEERILEKRATLQSVTVSEDKQEAYISFDRAPFNRESSTYEKWMLIESILKTMRENGIMVSQFYFLVHHQPINDMHLDFSHSWPSQGFFL